LHSILKSFTYELTFLEAQMQH